jgi:hypothetical protein
VGSWGSWGQGGRAGRDWGVRTASQSILVGPRAGGKVRPESRRHVSTSTVARRLETPFPRQ